ncbi:MAG: DegT/DnrJ/EryC1/StrS family aminotransferase, partial [Thermoplasmatales archaeon]|nr:DegT/DnrJ/EryC1/StrS family aminotransferase [Thermoplasmatales archaeon]
MQDKLALFGGKKTRSEPYPPYPVIGEEEKKGVLDVLNDGRLSTFIASAGTDFLGGKRIKELERLFCEYHNTKYAISFNSATAALHAAIVACGVDPGEEIITTPYTFTSTATSAFMHNAVPVFADIKPDTFNIDPEEIKKNNPLLKAIDAFVEDYISVEPFSQSARNEFEGAPAVHPKMMLKVIFY